MKKAIKVILLSISYVLVFACGFFTDAGLKSYFVPKTTEIVIERVPVSTVEHLLQTNKWVVDEVQKIEVNKAKAESFFGISYFDYEKDIRIEFGIDASKIKIENEIVYIPRAEVLSICLEGLHIVDSGASLFAPNYPIEAAFEEINSILDVNNFKFDYSLLDKANSDLVENMQNFLKALDVEYTIEWL